MLPFFFLFPYGAYALHNKDDEETENSESKSKKLKSTWGFHAGNSYATSDSSICKYCEKCNHSFSSKLESLLHKCE